MNAEELMIGDWVEFNGNKAIVKCPQKYTGEIVIREIGANKDSYCLANDVNPIPLTEYHLTHNEFLQRYDYINRINTFYPPNTRRWFKLESLASYDMSYFTFIVNDKVVRIKYLHELQHLLRLFKIDKEIVL